MPRAMDRGMWMDYLSSTAMLGCAACQRRIDLSLGSGLVFAGVFGAWVAFRPRYEPGPLAQHPPLDILWGADLPAIAGRGPCALGCIPGPVDDGKDSRGDS